MSNTAKGQYCRCEIELMLRCCIEVSFDIFIMISRDKILKLAHKDDDCVNTLKKYQHKGLKYFYVDQGDYDQFLAKYNDGFKKAARKCTCANSRLQSLMDGYTFAQEAAKSMGLKESSINILSEVNRESIKLLKTIPAMKELFVNKSSDSEKEHIKINIFSGYIASAMISTFEWQSQSIKEKAAFAALLKDIVLSEDELAEMKKPVNKMIGVAPNIKEHPLKIIDMLNKYPHLISDDILTMIQQHHERPDGNGYPYKLNHGNISFLSAISIVADHFAEIFARNEFDKGKEQACVEELGEQYDNGHFKQALKSLKTVLGMDPKQPSGPISKLA